jgi:DNA polymerase-4
MATPLDLPINYNRPLIMHIDLNSCFAIIEQQANPLIRHKPVAIAAYDTPRGAVIASSYEAKALGIKLGVNVREARMLCRDVIIQMPDPDKYFDAHKRFKKVLLNYTDTVTPKSVDEFVIDFRGSPVIQRGKSLIDVGYEIKADVKRELGEYVTVNIGIGPNRFLAKLAAGLHKPDGLDVIDGSNLEETYSQLTLVDLPGINVRYEARLNVVGIFTPVQFLHAPLQQLKMQVFQSINGYYWYLRLRGHEIDSVDFGRKSYGQQYALGDKTTDRAQLSRLLMKLCEKTGRRLRHHDYIAQGIYLWLSFEDRTYWAKGKDTKVDMYSTQDIYLHAQRLLNQVIIPARVTNIGVTVYKLKAASPEQLSFFDGTSMDTRSLARAADAINDRYGEFTIVPATMANMQNTILKRVAFGSVRDL